MDRIPVTSHFPSPPTPHILALKSLPRPRPLPPRVLGLVWFYSLEKVLFAIHAVPSAEAFLSQLGLAIAAFQAFAVPVSVQHLQDEPVHNVLVAACTERDFWEGGERDKGHNYAV